MIRENSFVTLVHYNFNDVVASVLIFLINIGVHCVRYACVGFVSVVVFMPSLNVCQLLYPCDSVS